MKGESELFCDILGLLKKYICIYVFACVYTVVMKKIEEEEEAGNGRVVIIICWSFVWVR